MGAYEELRSRFMGAGECNSTQPAPPLSYMQKQNLTELVIECHAAKVGDATSQVVEGQVECMLHGIDDISSSHSLQVLHGLHIQEPCDVMIRFRPVLCSASAREVAPSRSYGEYISHTHSSHSLTMSTRYDIHSLSMLYMGFINIAKDRITCMAWSGWARETDDCSEFYIFTHITTNGSIA